VPRDSIVAQLNIDIDRRGDSADLQGGGPGYLQVIGSRRLSTELGDVVERVNREGKHGFTSTTPTMPTASPTTTTAAATLHVRAVRDSHRLLHHRGPHGLPRVTDEPQVHRLPEDGAGGGFIEDVAR